MPGPLFQHGSGGGIQLDESNGTMGPQGNPMQYVKGFNPTNPHVGDAILATFFWFGAPGGLTGNIIESVTDHLSDPQLTPVGNTYELVEFVSNGQISQATYLATNVQNFPDKGTDPGAILVLKATWKVPVTEAGVMLSAWVGVAPTFAQALGQHRSGSGFGFDPLGGPTIAEPGPISVNAGALAYGVTLGSPPVNVDGPPGWTPIGTGSDPILKSDGDYDAQFTVSETGGTTNPQWSWFFTVSGSWLATVVALNPAPTTGKIEVTTTTSGENVPTSDYTVTVDGTDTKSIPPTGEIIFTDLQPGNHEVALSGVPENCEVTSANNPATVAVVAGETADVAFTVRCEAPPPPNDFVTGGGKLRGEGREFATLGLKAGPDGGKFTWVQHCPDNDDGDNGNGGTPPSAQCALGKFKFQGSVTPGTYAQGSRGPNCRTWSGTGTSKKLGARDFTVREACDGGEPGRGVDYLEVTIGDYQNSGYLSGGNIHLHRRKS